MRIVFMGTPEFAVPSLDILYKAGFDIAAVITSPDRMGGRGRKTLIESAVKKYAQSKSLPILQPTNLKSEAFISELEALKADLQIVVAFRMLPEVVWNMPPMGTYNLHGSLLPKYRGAAPINWAVIKGEQTTGVTSFKLKHAIDTGSILLQKEISILPTDTATDVHDRMMYIAADVILQTVNKIEKGEANLIEQDDSQVSHAPKLTKENTQLNLNQPVGSAYDFIRGLSQYPCAWFLLKDKAVKIYHADKLEEAHTKTPGEIATDNKTWMHVYCTNGYLNINELQFPGKKRMKVSEFLNGFDLEAFLSN